MKKIIAFALVGVLSVTVFTTQVSAQRNSRLSKDTRKALLDSLSPEQKKEFREKMRARYDSLSPDQKAKMKEQIKNRVDSLPPKEKRQLRKELLKRKKENG